MTTAAIEFENLLLASLALQSGQERKRRMLRISVIRLALETGYEEAIKVFANVTNDSLRKALDGELRRIRSKTKTEDKLVSLYQAEMDAQFNLSKHRKSSCRSDDQPSRFDSMFDAQFNWFYDLIIDEDKDKGLIFFIKLVVVTVIQFVVILSPWVGLFLLTYL